MSDKATRIVLDDFSGGRNGADAPLGPGFGRNQVVDAANGDWYRTAGFRRRDGSSDLPMIGSTLTGHVSTLIRHVPSTAESAAELWAVDDAATPVINRLAGGTVWTAPTLADSPGGNGWDVSGASINGKLFLAFKSGSGFAAPSAPTVANTGSGSYAATARYYRIRWTKQVGGVTTRRSPVGTAVSFTPSGTGSAARVTRPSLPGTGETHWELEVSYDNVTFRVLYGDGGINAAVAAATTTADDASVSSSSATIATFTSSGTWTRPQWVTSVQYLIVGGGGGGGGTGSTGWAGGGGGGGVLTGTDTGLASTSYAIVVGSGGAGNTVGSGTAGGNSSFNGHTATGGGGGGGNGQAGGSGGSGGGGGSNGAAGIGTVGQGHDGGAGGQAGGGGGGGASGAGTGGDNEDETNGGGDGGAGSASSISGSSVTYGGGGGGQGNGSGGTGGGGAGGGTNAGTAGTDGLGGGGGAGSGGARGGSGVVILSYSVPSITNAGLSNADNSNRLHVWDGSTVRRAGLPVPSAPTVANSGTAGTFAATIAYWRVRWVQLSGGITIRRSEPSASTSFTPDGSHDGVVVTRPTAAGEGETHWELELSTDNATFYVVYGAGATAAATAIATTTATLNAAYSSVQSSDPISALTGTYTLQKSYRFVAADQNRLLGYGSYTTTDKQNRIEVSAVVGSLDVGDAERVDTTSTYKYDLDENDSGDATGLVGPVWGNFYAFKTRQMWELLPTGSVASPYRLTAITKELGALGPRAVCVGDDAQGNPCLYLFTHRGVYRYAQGLLTYIGRGIEDLVLGPTSTINLAAAHVVAHLTFYADRRQLWAWWATGSSDDPDTCAVYDAMANAGQGAWSRITGAPAAARCAVQFANSIGASMGTALVPYVGTTAANNTVLKAVDTTVSADSGTGYQAFVTTRPIEVAGSQVELGDALLLAPAASGATVSVTVTPDFGAQPTQTGSADLTPAGSETRVSPRVEGMGLTGAQFMQLTIGDASAASTAWSVDRLVVPVRSRGTVAA